MRALVVSNMRPDAARPERGSFVRDQVAALRSLGQDGAGAGAADSLEVELYEFAPGARALARAARELRRRFAAERFDIVHAHFGLTAWPALAVAADARALTLHGTDLRHPRTRLLTRAALPRIDLLATVSAALADELPRRAAARAQVLPCGIDLERFAPLPRIQARDRLALDPEKPYLLFAADPSRPEKRYELARQLADDAGVELLSLGGVEPARVPLLVNAANAVLVPSAREGFGLAVLEALACDVPVLATPVGIHEQALDGIAGTLCAPFELARWRAALAPHLFDADPRVAGRSRAERYSAVRMAERVAGAWRTARGRAG
ncbi:MAG TPA: glycosyltransferase [Solirubrobacteraceae bacterium]|nr:glycosyltransferase [Solirubrobacteraceae bacterium]